MVPSSPCNNVVWCSGEIKAWLSSLLCVLTASLSFAWTALRAVRILPVLGVGASTGFYLKSCQMYRLPLRWRSPSFPLSWAELLSCCCPLHEVRWVSQLLALCLAFLLLGLAAKSYNIAGRRDFCCRAIILLGEGNSVVLSYSRDAV